MLLLGLGSETAGDCPPVPVGITTQLTLGARPSPQPLITLLPYTAHHSPAATQPP